MEAKSSGARMEVILLGTGTSGQVPSIVCLTEGGGEGCRCCCGTGDRKDQRRNTSALVRIHPAPVVAVAQKLPHHHQVTRNILIDVGKSFCEAAREHFPKHRIRKLDAVLLTHPHADAVNGLDDLRAWTLGGAIQASIAIYCNAYTHGEIARMYPYMVDSHARTGGGDVPQFTWHILRDGEAFDLFGIEILPLAVHHGKFFEANRADRPYLCTSYLLDGSVYYVSDVSAIPSETLAQLEQRLAVQKPTSPTSEQQKVGLQVLIIDTLRLLPHASHFGIAQAIHVARWLQPVRTYLVGFTHRVSHDCWTYCCQAISQGRPSSAFDPSPCTHVYPEQHRPHPPAPELLKKGIVEDYDWFTARALRLIEANPPSSSASAPHPDHQPPWVRPGFDGLVIHTNPLSSAVHDSFYT